MEIPDYMVEQLEEILKLKNKESELTSQIWPDLTKKFATKYPEKEKSHENKLSTALWIALCEQERLLEKNIREKEVILKEREQKNNSCDNTSH
ncbi:hypothetical protein [Oceanobacillus sp. CF4.6]|uniref:hypothetical protein n=1 Tax=Oceanobacillus sp. CF4.6 TaxID=3373080 RepID=UPI003EE729BB